MRDRCINSDELTNVAVSNHVLDGGVDAQRVGGGNNLRNLARIGLRCVQHGMSLKRVHGHARLAENMLAGVQCGDSHRCVHIRPGANADGVYLIVVDHFLPIGSSVWNVELCSRALARFQRSIGNSDDLNTILLVKPGHVP